MDKNKFIQLFKKAMSINTYYDCFLDKKGIVQGEVTLAKPCFTIRDFEIDSFPSCDSDFRNVNKAWDYFQSINYYRIIAVDGTILADNYCN